MRPSVRPTVCPYRFCSSGTESETRRLATDGRVYKLIPPYFSPWVEIQESPGWPIMDSMGEHVYHISLYHARF